jgi:hypothetical protein
MASKLCCYHCSTSIQTSALQRIGFRESCSLCGRDIHVCRNCQHYDENAHHECRESSAEWVRDKERANRCEYFSASGQDSARGSSATDTRAALEALFKK